MTVFESDATRTAMVDPRNTRETNRPKKPARAVGNTILNVVLVFGAMLMLLPFVWMFVTSVSPASEAFSLPPHWIPSSITFQNFAAVFTQIPFAQQALNSIIVTSSIVVGSLALACLAAYPLARLRFRGRQVVFFAFLSALMIPSQMTIIPVYLILRQLGLVNNLGGLILPALIQVLAIFLLRQHMASLPEDLSDAARLDGAGHLRILWSIIVPNIAPSLAALAILIAQQYWNDFFWPNIVIADVNKQTLPLALVSLQGSFNTGSPTVLFAAISMIVTPLFVLFLFLSRQITKGLSIGGAFR